MISYPDQLRPGDIVPGFGVVQRANAGHVTGGFCRGEGCAGCDPLGRWFVRFFGDERPHVMSNSMELEVNRPGDDDDISQPADYRPDMLDRL